MKVVNLFGGPGCGKSTNAAGLFYEMKRRYISAEYVTEYAKAMVYERRHNILADQLYILAKQHRMLSRLAGHGIDFAIMDSPLPTSLFYLPEDYYSHFSPLLLEIYNSYENVNILLTRNHPYDPNGRTQKTEEEAIDVDNRIRVVLDQYGIPFTEMASDDTVPTKLMEMLFRE
jgi:nicotinamide riboside kinase